MTTYIQVAVPEHLLESVYRLLLEETTSGPVPMPARHDGWTPSEIDQLERRLRNPAGRAVLDAIAQATLEGREVSYEELRVDAGNAAGDPEFSFNQLRGQLSWIGRYAKSVRGSDDWPIEFRDHGPDRSSGERYSYRMSPELAKRWLEVSGRR